MANSNPFRLAILDDDPEFTDIQRNIVTRRFPAAQVTVGHEPRPIPAQDVYLVDNRFDGTERAISLAKQIRVAEPQSLVIVWSGCVTKELLKKLAPVGINAVAEKGNRDDLEAAMQVIDHYVRREKSTRSFGGTIRCIRDLLALWNERLALEERQAPA